MDGPVVICPLDIERRALEKVLDGRARVLVSGPGPEAARKCIETLLAKKPHPRLVVIFGLAGGLAETDDVAPRVGWVSDKDGRRWNATYVSPGNSEPVGLMGVDEAVTTVDRKRKMAEAYGAALVDCESHVIARLCVEHRVNWAVVRGVSDGPNKALPAGVEQWVDDKGKTRVLKVALNSIMHPSVLGAAISLGMNAKPALKHAAGRLIELLEAERCAPHTVRVTITAPESGARRVPETLAPGASPNTIEAQLGRKLIPTQQRR